MSKNPAFRIEFDGRHRDFTARQWQQFRADLQAYNWVIEFPDGRFFVRGKQVSHAEALDAVKAIDDAKLAKKLETHRLISWKAGDCENTRRWKWVSRQPAAIR